ncbi:TRAP transporter small permease subunit [Chrysiogenes arsenatis]|uniref:TRAP transporter small permease subunit n=1 Tax=Chrysiogenes arsenatis TaxID=309797 RepID=UPI00041B1C58|nr:TRAP transporter small permease subunit [Chrysiogenes arsenatis]
MRTLIHLIDRFSDLTGRILSSFAYFLLVVVLYEVVARKIFGRPTVWGFDASYILMAAFFLLGFGYTLKHRMHVAIDIFTQKFRPRLQGAFGIVGYLVFFFPFVCIGMWITTKYALQAWNIYELSQSPWSFPVYWFKTLMPISFLLLFIQGIAEFLRNVLKLKGEEIG